MEVIKLMYRTLGNVLGYYFTSDMDVMSEDAKRVFSNEEDRKILMEALERLKNSNNVKEETITLSNDEKITLVA